MELPTTLYDCIPIFESLVNELESALNEAVVHTKKIGFALSLFREFVTYLSKQESLDMVLNSIQIESFRGICEILNELKELMTECGIHCWTHQTVETQSSSVATVLCSLVDRLSQATSHLDPDLAQLFDPNSPQWLSLHVLDLHSIQISFETYIDSSASNVELRPLINERLKSINDFLQKYEDKEATPALRVFSPIPVHYQSWRVSHDDYEIIREIGQGISATVYYGLLKKDGKKIEVAIKQLKYKQLTGAKLQTFQREIAVLATSAYPTLLSFLGATDTPPYCILTEWMPNGNLYQELHKFKRLSPTMRTIAAFDIARGMQFLHSRHILHRDLKSLNVLLDANGHAHICDFGFSRKENDDADYMTTNIGTPHWMAPELLKANGFYTNKIDVYSYGILLWEITSGCLPFFGMDPTQVITSVLVHDLRPAIPMSASKPLRDLIVHCWDKDPQMRPSFDEIVRRFNTGECLLPGADREEFLAYVGEKIGEDNAQAQRIERQLDAEVGDTQTLVDLVETIETEGMPPELITRCFEMVEKCKAGDPKVVGRALSLFLRTPLKSRAAALLRKLPSCSVAVRTMCAAVEMIPSGSDDFDTDIVIAGCKNGSADYCVVYAIQPKHLKIALECAARQGVDIALKAAVADRCVQCLGTNDTGLICAAVRCLIGIGEIRRLTIPLLRQHLLSNDQGLHNCICVAAAIFIDDGHVLPHDITRLLVNLAATDCVAEGLLVKACIKSEVTSTDVMALMKESSFKPPTKLKLLLAAARHPNLLQDARELSKDITMNDPTQEMMDALSALASA